MHPTPPGGSPAKGEPAHSGSVTSNALDAAFAQLGQSSMDDVKVGSSSDLDRDLHDQEGNAIDQAVGHGGLGTGGAQDARFAELGQSSAPTDSEREAGVLLKSLLGAIASGANTDLGVVPQGPGLTPPVPAVPSELFDSFGLHEVKHVAESKLECGIIHHIFARGGSGGTPLGDAVKLIRKGYLDGGEPLATMDKTQADIVRVMLVEQPSLAYIAGLVGDAELDIPLSHTYAVRCCLGACPQLWRSLEHRKVRVAFASTTANGKGGGYFVDGVIHMSELLNTPPGAFVRLLVHEIGHATFQPVLLDDRPVPSELDKGEVAGLASRFERSPEKLCALVQELRSYWEAMPARAKTFYQAWQVLRRDRET